MKPQRASRRHDIEHDEPVAMTKKQLAMAMLYMRHLAQRMDPDGASSGAKHLPYISIAMAILTIIAMVLAATIAESPTLLLIVVVVLGALYARRHYRAARAPSQRR